MGSSGAGCLDGPLAAQAEGFRARLIGLGYAPCSVVVFERTLRQLSGWMAVEGIESGGLTSEALERFGAAKRAAGRKTPLGLGALVLFLREAGLIPAAPAVVGPVAEVLGVYRRYLRVERRLAELSVVGAEDVVRRFLSARAAGRPRRDRRAARPAPSQAV